MNTRIALALVIAAAGWGTGCATAPMKESVAAQRQIAEELHTLNTTLADLAATIKSNQAPRPFTRASFDFQHQGPDREALMKIKLPDPLTEASARAYVGEIMAVSAGQNSYSDRDPQVALLAKVGEDNIAVLLDYSEGNGASSYHLNKAVQRVATARSKALILAKLPEKKSLASVVLKHGWATDARETLLAGLTDDYVPSEWLTALASLRDTNTYPALLKYLVEGQNRVTTYEAIKHLPGIELAPSVAAAWERSRYGQRWEANGMAVIALGYGHISALESIIRAIQLPDTKQNDYELSRLLNALWEYTEYVGSPEDLVAWYEANKTTLVFDPSTKKFRKGP